MLGVPLVKSCTRSRPHPGARWRAGVALLAAALALAQSSCSLYRITVQQGNVITQEMVNGLKPGMTREQVAYIMGEPVVRNPFNENQWDYVYTLRVPGQVDRKRKLSLFFADGVLSQLTGDFKPGAEGEDAESGGSDDS